MVFVPASELDTRLARLQHSLDTAGLDGALLHGVSNLLYFAGTAQQCHLWVPRQGEPTLLVRRVLERARRDSALTNIEGLSSIKQLPDRIAGATRIGMELDILPVSLFERYRRVLPEVSVEDIGPLTRVIRAVKSELEMDRIRAAAAAADATHRQVVAALAEGVSELELSIVAESAERRHGFQGMLRWRATTGFECPWVHVLAGASGVAFSFTDTPFGGEGVSVAAPYGAGHRRVQRGMPVCLDFALARDGYIHDMTRTMVVGGLDQELERAYQVCREMQDMVRECARPGVTGGELWDRCVERATAAGLEQHFMGFGDQRVRFVGHGVGLELDELPVLAPRQSMALEAGHVIAVEPKFFFPGRGAVGLENTYAIHQDRVETLTVTADDLVVVT